MKHFRSLALLVRATAAASGQFRWARFTVILTIVAVCFQFTARAQSTAPATTAPAHHGNALISPEAPSRKSTRAAEVIQRAAEHPGACDIEFIGDTLTQGWEVAGKNVWQEFYGGRKTINMGVTGDQPQHVLWRIEHGQLDGIDAKAAVVLIGTHAADHHAKADILEGITAVVNHIRQRQPNTKILLMGLFPQTQTVSELGGKILQINQELARLDDGKNIFFFDIGPQLIGKDGSISPDMMHDRVHPSEAGYRVWATAIEPKLKQILGGDITGTVTLSGTPPPETEITPLEDDPICGKMHSGKVFTGFCKVGANKGLADVVVMLKGVPAQAADASKPPALLDQKGGLYVPQILAMQTGQTLLVRNSDPMAHSVAVDFTAAANVNKYWDKTNQAQTPGGADLTFSFPAPEDFLKFHCDMHPWMFAWVTIVDNPYFAVTGPDGKFTIKNVPPGKYTISALHYTLAKIGVDKQVEVKDGGATVDFTIEVK
jgi:hypothetical protein